MQDKSATPKSQGPSGGRYNDKFRGGPGEKGGNSNSWESPGYKHSPAGAKPSPMYQNRSSAMADRAKEKLKGGFYIFYKINVRCLALGLSFLYVVNIGGVL